MDIVEREMFKKAICEGLIRRYEHDIDNWQESAECSINHQVRMKQIISRKYERQLKLKSSRKKIIIAIIAAALVLLTGCTLYIYRNEIGNFIETIYQDFGNIRHKDAMDESANIEREYQMTYVPEGYELVSKKSRPTFVLYEWADKEGNYINFTQTLIGQAFFGFDFEDGKSEIISRYNIYHRESNGVHFYLWENDIYVISLYSSTDLGENELIKIVDGIK